MPKKSTPKVSAQQAVTFDGFSVQNSAIVQAHFTCGCQPYADVFTYDRWKALGQQVQKGQHGLKLQIYKTFHKEKDGADVSYTVPWTSTVFCRHQVKPVGEK